MNRFIALFSLLCMFALTAHALAQQSDISASQPIEEKSSTWRHFENLISTIDAVREELDQARKALVDAQTESERKQAQAELERLTQELSSLQLAWEMWAAGGVDMALFKPAAEEEKFDWRSELESVFEPILVELRRLTERPRKIERLRSEQLHFQQRLVAAEAALKSVAEYRAQAPSPQLVSAFSELEKRWTKRRDDLQDRLDLINFELRELLSPSADAEQKSIDVLKELFTGRLLNLLLAILAAVFVYVVIWQANRIYSRWLLRRGRRPSLASRALHLVLVMIGSLVALLAGMAVLYARGDWILLGLLIIILVGMALALQRYLPGYLSEAKLLLNIGAVREGERVIYNGLPWQVQTLRVYSTLVNPWLTGATLRLPLSSLTALVSRPFDEREPWFPTRQDDYVVLSDETFGRVILQTPETVQLRVAGAIKNFTAPGFLDQNPRNLSLDGFMVVLRFGIDYRHQPDVTESIRERLESYIFERLQRHPLGKHVQSVALEFAQAGASSLDFIGIVSCDSAAAGAYLQLNRLLQKIAVEACNENGWVIPFSQLSVHLAREEG